VANIRTTDPTPPRAYQANIPPAFERAVMRLMSKHPSDRYHTAAELIQELEQIARDSGIVKV
jgi:hypothetical protein